MLHRKILIAILFGALLSGCWTSNGYLEVAGKILDEKTLQSIGNRKVVVYELETRDAPNYLNIVGEFKTDSLGKFNYSFRKSEVTYFYNFQIMGDSAYSFSNNILGMTELNRHGKFLTFRMKKLTDLSIKIERTAQTTFQDTLFVSWRTDEIDGETLYPYKIVNYENGANSPLRWIGGNIKSVVKTKVFADKKTVVSWKLFRSGRLQNFTDTIFCERSTDNSISLKY
jgi:hypothetical protein